MEPCQQCAAPATVHAQWIAAGERQDANLCERCMDAAWKQFGRTTQFTLSQPAATVA